MSEKHDFKTEAQAREAAYKYAEKDSELSVARGGNVNLYSVSRPAGFVPLEGGGRMPAIKRVAEFHYQTPNPMDDDTRGLRTALAAAIARADKAEAELLKVRSKIDEFAEAQSADTCPACSGAGGERWIEQDGSEGGQACSYCNGTGKMPTSEWLREMDRDAYIKSQMVFDMTQENKRLKTRAEKAEAERDALKCCGNCVLFELISGNPVTGFGPNCKDNWYTDGRFCICPNWTNQKEVSDE